jgi:hypothetical protein
MKQSSLKPMNRVLDSGLIVAKSGFFYKAMLVVWQTVLNEAGIS